jgi:U3 small nucleolar RNA-associated protein 15
MHRHLSELSITSLLRNLPIYCYQPDETHIAAGMSDGTLSVRRRQSKPTSTDLPFSASAMRTGAFEFFLGGTASKIGQGTVRNKIKTKPLGDENELRVESRRSKRLKEYDRLMKGFKYSAVLDSVLRKVCELAWNRCFANGPHFSKFHQQQNSRSYRS